MSTPLRPMLADTAEFDKLRFPIAIQPKYDGIRCIMHEGKAYSRSLKLIPNQHIQAFAAANLWMHELDGEWIVGSPQEDGVYNRTHRFVMTEETDGFHPEAVFYVFDIATKEKIPYTKRLYNATQRIRAESTFGRVQTSPIGFCHSREEVETFVAKLIENGYEGAILRDPDGFYKAGRATVKQGQLLKVKQWVDTEGVVVDTEPLFINNNEAKVNELGRTSRSSHKENQQRVDTLGAIVLTLPWNGETTTVKVGTGFTAQQRQEIWNMRDKLPGQIVKFKYIPFGSLYAPRHPSFIGFRHEADMGE